MKNVTQFKGWSIPGDFINPASQNLTYPSCGTDASTHESADESLDALSGHMKIYQLKKGHRYSTDDVLVAWFATANSGQVRTALDLGSGLSSVAMMCAWKLRGAHFTTIEAQETSFHLSQKSVLYNQLSLRFTQHLGDFRESSKILGDLKFDLVTGTPPYFDLNAGLHGNHDQKIRCRFETRGSILDYCKTATQHLAPAGFLFLIFPTAFEKDWVPQLSSLGLVILKNRPVQFKEGEPPLLTLYQLARSVDFPKNFLNKLPLQGFSEPSLIIRTQDGTIHPEYSIIKFTVGFPP